MDVSKSNNSTEVPIPSEGELRLLRTLWKSKRLSAREIHEASRKATGWAYSTTRKTLERMEAKSLVRIQTVHGIKTYIALVGKVETMARLITRFSKRILDGEGPMPASAFINSKLIDPAELDELEALLQAYDVDRDETSDND